MSPSCKNCGGTMLGDGYTTPMHCEFASEELYQYNEPDCAPVFCGVEEIGIMKRGVHFRLTYIKRVQCKNRCRMKYLGADVHECKNCGVQYFLKKVLTDEQK